MLLNIAHCPGFEPATTRLSGKFFFPEHSLCGLESDFIYGIKKKWYI